MKRIIRLSAICILAWVIAAPGCKDKKAKVSPEKTIAQFFELMNAKEFEKAKESGTENTREYIEMIESYVMLGGKATPLPFQKTVCEVKGKIAKCTYCCNHRKESETISLVLKKGKWYVDLTKEETTAFLTNDRLKGDGEISAETKDVDFD